MPQPSSTAPGSPTRAALVEADGSDAPDRPMLSLSEAAEVLGVHYMTAYRYVRTGLLGGYQEKGRWQVSPDDLNQFHASRRDPSGPGRQPLPRTARSAASAAASVSRRYGRRAGALADRLIAGDEVGAWRIIDDVLAAGGDLDEVYLGLVAASLTEVGDRWEAGSATVADEHRASVVAMRLVGRLGPLARRPGRTSGTVVISAAPGDRHGLPTALMADLLRRRGLQVLDLGADTPAEFLALAAASADRLVAVGLCATTTVGTAAGRQLKQAIDLVKERVAVPVLVGGRGAQDPELLRRVGADASSLHATQAIEWFESHARGHRGPGPTTEARLVP